MDHAEFQQMIKEGCHTDDRISSYILQNVATTEHKQFMADHSFDIAMILNGRIVQGTVPEDELLSMVLDWNKELGFDIIFTEFL